MKRLSALLLCPLLLVSFCRAEGEEMPALRPLPEGVTLPAAKEQAEHPAAAESAAATAESVADAVASVEAAAETAEAPASASEPVRYRDPAMAMYHRRAHVVEIEISAKWKLTEAQMETAQRAPKQKEGSKPARYIYPEDVAPTEEEKANGTALTETQRANMRKARKRALQEACWQAYLDAERYNKEHDAELTQMEKQGKHIVINLKKQKGVYKDGNKELLSFSICSGRKSKPTPKGHFHVMEKDRNHRSNLYNEAKMPFFLRLTLGGVGLHQGNLPGYPASHGCIRLSEKTARYLFKNCEVGTPVFID